MPIPRASGSCFGGRAWLGPAQRRARPRWVDGPDVRSPHRDLAVPRNGRAKKGQSKPRGRLLRPDGSGIAEAAARAGLDVRMVDLDLAALERGRERARVPSELAISAHVAPVARARAMASSRSTPSALSGSVNVSMRRSTLVVMARP
jgi:hypothetical protein